MNLSEDQNDAFERCLKGENVFITGPGGCGKSFLLHKIVDELGRNKKVQVCAMTGCAAILLKCNACTLHSWSGIGLAKGDHNAIMTRIELDKYKRMKWRKTDVLILDEVSMLSYDIFELLNGLGQKIRKSAKPFGGIQVIFTGDFLQLPPIPDKNNPDSARFCFESPLWNQTFHAQILLDKVFRQTDNEYIELLHQVREGSISKKNLELMKSRIITPEQMPVMLMARRNQADTLNASYMNAINEETKIFKYKTKYDVSDFKIPPKQPTATHLHNEEKYMIQNSLFEKEISLKKGCRVMSIVNIDLELGLCNGSTGEIVDFDPFSYPIVKFDNGMKITIKPHDWKSEAIPGFSICQIPLILAWAITIHKSQGSTLDKAYIDLGHDVFAEGQTYVALSRVKSLQGLYLKSFNPYKIRANRKVIEFYDQFYE